MTDHPESRVRSVPVADVLTREGRDDPADRRRADRPRRALKTAAGAAVVVGALWGLHDQFTPEHTGVSETAAATITPPPPPTTAAAAEVIGPKVLTGQVVTTQTPQAPPPPPAAPPATAQAETKAAAPKRTRSPIPNPVQILVDVARRLGGG